MQIEGLFYAAYMCLVAVVGSFARTAFARVTFGRAMGKYYNYLTWHNILGTALTIGMVFYDLDNPRMPYISQYIVGFIVIIIPTGISLYFTWNYWLFDFFDPTNADRVPPGAHIWAIFNRKTLASEEDNAKTPRPSLRDIAAAKLETHKTKLTTYELAAETEYLNAQIEMERKARELKEAKARAEEARRRYKRGSE